MEDYDFYMDMGLSEEEAASIIIKEDMMETFFNDVLINK